MYSKVICTYNQPITISPRVVKLLLVKFLFEDSYTLNGDTLKILLMNILGAVGGKCFDLQVFCFIQSLSLKTHPFVARFRRFLQYQNAVKVSLKRYSNYDLTSEQTSFVLETSNIFQTYLFSSVMVLDLVVC